MDYVPSKKKKQQRQKKKTFELQFLSLLLHLITMGYFSNGLSQQLFTEVNAPTLRPWY